MLYLSLIIYLQILNPLRYLVWLELQVHVYITCFMGFFVLGCFPRENWQDRDTCCSSSLLGIGKLLKVPCSCCVCQGQSLHWHPHSFCVLFFFVVAFPFCVFGISMWNVTLWILLWFCVLKQMWIPFHLSREEERAQPALVFLCLLTCHIGPMLKAVELESSTQCSCRNSVCASPSLVLLLRTGWGFIKAAEV